MAPTTAMAKESAPKHNFTLDKDVIANLEDKEKNRILAILLSLKGDLADFKIDWACAAERYGTNSKEGMRVNSAKVLSKIKIAVPAKAEECDDSDVGTYDTNNGDDADASDTLVASPTPKASKQGTKRKAKTAVTTETSNGDAVANDDTNNAVDNANAITDAAAEPAPKRARKKASTPKSKTKSDKGDADANADANVEEKSNNKNETASVKSASPKKRGAPRGPRKKTAAAAAPLKENSTMEAVKAEEVNGQEVKTAKPPKTKTPAKVKEVKPETIKEESKNTDDGDTIGTQTVTEVHPHAADAVSAEHEQVASGVVEVAKAEPEHESSSAAAGTVDASSKEDVTVKAATEAATSNDEI